MIKTELSASDFLAHKEENRHLLQFWAIDLSEPHGSSKSGFSSHRFSVKLSDNLIGTINMPAGDCSALFLLLLYPLSLPVFILLTLTHTHAAKQIQLRNPQEAFWICSENSNKHKNHREKITACFGVEMILGSVGYEFIFYPYIYPGCMDLKKINVHPQLVYLSDWV